MTNYIRERLLEIDNGIEPINKYLNEELKKLEERGIVVSFGNSIIVTDYKKSIDLSTTIDMMELKMRLTDKFSEHLSEPLPEGMNLRVKDTIVVNTKKYCIIPDTIAVYIVEGMLHDVSDMYSKWYTTYNLDHPVDFDPSSIAEDKHGYFLVLGALDVLNDRLKQRNRIIAGKENCIIDIFATSDIAKIYRDDFCIPYEIGTFDLHKRVRYMMQCIKGILNLEIDLDGIYN